MVEKMWKKGIKWVQVRGEPGNTIPRSRPGNSVPDRRDHTVHLRAAMISPSPEEAATQRRGRGEGCLLCLSQEHNPGQSVNIYETLSPPLPQQGRQYVCSLLYFPLFYQRNSKYLVAVTEQSCVNEEPLEAVFPLGISLNFKHMY